MLTVKRVVQLIRTGRQAQAFDAVLANGRALPAEARARLARPSSLRMVAPALALQRVMELSYGPTPEAEELAATVVREVEMAAGYGCGLEVAGGAVTGAVLAAWLAAASHAAADPTLTERAVAALRWLAGEIAAQQQRAAARPHTAAPSGGMGDALDTSLVAWQLASSPGLAAAVLAAGGDPSAVLRSASRTARPTVVTRPAKAPAWRGAAA